MDNPYSPPRAAENGPLVSANPVRKPGRIWALQVLCVLQLAGLVTITAISLPSVPPNYLREQFLPDVVRFVFGFTLLATTVVSLQRRVFSRPEVVAPLSASALFVAHLLNALAHYAERTVTPFGQTFMAVIMYAAYLWLVGSLFLHRPTRLYLRGVSASPPTTSALP